MAHELVKEQSKKFYFRQCVFTGLAGIDGAHIFPAGDFPALADFPENIVPAVRMCHALFDTRADGSRRPVSEKLWILRRITIEDIRPRINKALRLLSMRCTILHIDFPEEVAPYDEQILRGWQGGGRTSEADDRYTNEAFPIL